MTTKKHRPAGDGSIYKDEKRGRWIAQFQVGYDSRTGRAIKRTRTCTTQKEAREALASLREKGYLIMGSGNQVKATATTGGNYAIWGDLLVLSAQLCYALYIVLYKNFVNKYSLTTIMKWMFTYSFICTLPFSARDLINADWTGLQATEIGSLIFIVVGATFISYMLIVVGQKNLRPTVAGMYNYIQPLVATLVAVCWGMETFDPTKICSVLLIFSGVYLVTTSRSRADAEKSRLQPESPRKRQ